MGIITEPTSKAGVKSREVIPMKYLAQYLADKFSLHNREQRTEPVRSSLGISFRKKFLHKVWP